MSARMRVALEETLRTLKARDAGDFLIPCIENALAMSARRSQVVARVEVCIDKAAWTETGMALVGIDDLRDLLDA